MNTFIKIIVFVAVFSLTVAAIFFFHLEKVTKMQQTTFQPVDSTFVQQPPLRAVTGSISDLVGDVKKDARFVPDLIAITATDSAQMLTILSSEGLITGPESSVTVTFPNLVTVKLEANTQVAFDSPFPDAFLIRQSRGNVHLIQQNPATTFSVRAFHFLFSFSGGNATISLDETKKTATITLDGGSGKIGMIDLSNNTKTWDVAGPGTAIIQDKKRTVTVESTAPSN